MAAAVDSKGARDGRQFLTLREVVRLTGSHPNSIRRAADSGELKVYRLPSGHRRWTLAHVHEWLGIESTEGSSTEPPGAVVIYARVSSHKQSKGIDKGELNNDLGRQIARLKKVAIETYECKTPVVFSDTGSGLSFTRKALKRLISDILAGKYNNSILLCTHKDRLARFGTEVILQICKFQNVEVVFTETAMDASQERELADDLIAIIQHFAARTYGARAAKTNAKSLSAETIKRAKDLLDQGNSVWQVEDALRDGGFRTEDGKIISQHVIRKYVARNKLLKELVPTRPKTNLQEYVEQCLEQAEPHARISIRVVYQHYVAWCRARNESPARINKLGQLLGKLGYQGVGTIGDAHMKGYAALKIRGQNFHVYLKQFRKGTALHELMKTRLIQAQST